MAQQNVTGHLLTRRCYGSSRSLCGGNPCFYSIRALLTWSRKQLGGGCGSCLSLRKNLFFTILVFPNLNPNALKYSRSERALLPASLQCREAKVILNQCRCRYRHGDFKLRCLWPYKTTALYSLNFMSTICKY